MVVVFPFDSRFKDVKFTKTCISILCGLSMFVSCFLILFYKTQYTILSTISCLPFSNKSEALFYLTTWFIIISKFIILLAIMLIGHFLYKISNQSKKLNSQNISVKSKLIISQFILQTTSNFLCWCPMNIVYIVLLVFLIIFSHPFVMGHSDHSTNQLFILSSHIYQ